MSNSLFVLSLALLYTGQLAWMLYMIGAVAGTVVSGYVASQCLPAWVLSGLAGEVVRVSARVELVWLCC